MRFSKKKRRGPKKKIPWKDKLTDNVAANEYFSPFYFLMVYFLLNQKFSINLTVLKYSIISTAIYVYSSNFFQPDLDIHHSRPGMGHFPLGKWAAFSQTGHLLKKIFYPINRFWYYLWHPFGQTFTHRGVTHWPILSTWLRVGYLWMWTIIFIVILGVFKFDVSYLFKTKEYLESFFPWNLYYGWNFWLIFCFPVYLSDLFHIFIDYLDSVKRGYTFCPPRIPRGNLIKLVNKIKKRK